MSKKKSHIAKRNVNVSKENFSNAKRKVYVICTVSFKIIGGTELYVAGKAKYLEDNGWEVYVCTGEHSNDGSCLISSLNKYLNIGGGWTFLNVPTYKMKKFEQEQILNFMINRLNLLNYADCEIIFESHVPNGGYWMELLAQRVQGKHFVVAIHEDFTVPGYTYRDNLDFFYFKWQRNEIIGHTEFIRNLFNGYKNVTKPLINMPDTIREQDPIQDVPFNNIESLQKLDWNICHIGRTIKPYVAFAIIGVGELAKRYPNKKIHFMMIGDAKYRYDLLQKTFNGLPKVKLTFFGDLAPIPRILFSKFDVVIAGAGSALFAADEGVLTINANPNTDKTPGVLGYDTKDILYGKDVQNHISYVEALENVLVKRLYDNKKYKMPEILPAKIYYDKFWGIVKNSAQTKEYYVEKLSQERIRNWIAIFPFGIVPKNSRIILYGATEIRKDYIQQVNGQKYCQILTTVDEDFGEYDNSVVSLDRLKNIDYDGIVIATFQREAQAAYNKIMQIVPQMNGRIVYNLQMIFV